METMRMPLGSAIIQPACARVRTRINMLAKRTQSRYGEWPFYKQLYMQLRARGSH